jgi:dolichol-phosphate mannosyltransferase
MISPVPLYTYTSIFRAYRWSVVESVPFEADGFVSAAEILIRAAGQGYSIIEVPMVLRGRQLGATKMKIARTIGRHFTMMGTLLLQRIGLREFQSARQQDVRATASSRTVYQYSSEKE